MIVRRASIEHFTVWLKYSSRATVLFVILLCCVSQGSVLT